MKIWKPQTGKSLMLSLSLNDDPNTSLKFDNNYNYIVEFNFKVELIYF